MCAIFGIIGRSDLELIKKISRIQEFRGPDDQSYFDSEDKLATIGNNRLAVIDKVNGKQPMFSQDGRYVLVFNGCIYNFREIKSYLTNKGISFKTECDTEVVVNSFMYFGKKSFNYFDGMWSLAIYDLKEKKCYLSRDYAGQKPFYYTLKNNYLLFSSQINGLFQDDNIDREITEDGLKQYFAYSFNPAPQTIYKNILQVKPGEIIEIDSTNLKISKSIYWDIGSGPDYNIFFKKENSDNFMNNFDDLINQFCIADKEPVLSLSGGIDSQILLNRLINKKKKFSSYTLGFDNESYDESKFLDDLKGDFNKNVLKVDDKILEEKFYELSKKITEPNGDSSLLPTYILFNKIKDVSNLSIGGDGGDESFFGYITFDAFFIANVLKKIFPKSFLKIFKILTNFKSSSEDYLTFQTKVKKFFESINYEREFLLPTWMSCLNLDDIKKKFNTEMKHDDLYGDFKIIYDGEKDLMRKAQLYYFKFYLPMVLSKVDQASMHNSVENRSPFISKRLINFSLSQDISKLYSLFNKKKFLKSKFKNIISNNVLKRPKHGFAFQKEIILKNENLINQLMKYEFVVNKDFFEKKYKEYLKGNNEYSNYIWNELALNLVQQNNSI
tara:strand:- start:688 stop:2523 length:1836 start_codon:yes stop_codon:yes gene_type:complete